MDAHTSARLQGEPFPEGILAGAVTPQQLAEKARQDPRAAAPLFEKGLVAAWFGINGWDYPVTGPDRIGKGALEKYLQAVGPAQPPRMAKPNLAVKPSGRTEPALPPPVVRAAATPAVTPPAVSSPAPTPPLQQASPSRQGSIATTIRVSLLAGWAAFAGWLLAEVLVGQSVDEAQWAYLFMTTTVAGMIALGLTLFGIANLHWKSQLHRLGLGLTGGLLGGLAGGYLGNLVYEWMKAEARTGSLLLVGRTLGWTCMGLAIGLADGLHNASVLKLRNGLIGGVLGGLIGGLLFNPLSQFVGSPLPSRACAFVLLGLCIGLFLGLVQQLFKEAWLTVVEGFRTGRQLILAQEVTSLGTSERANLIFIAYGAQGVEPIHFRIRRAAKGKFLVEDNHSRGGTRLNGKTLTGPTVLREGDLLQFGKNAVRFNERYHASASSRA